MIDTYNDVFVAVFGSHSLTFNGLSWQVLQGVGNTMEKADKSGVMVTAQTTVLIPKGPGIPGINDVVQLDGIEMQVLSIAETDIERRLELVEV